MKLIETPLIFKKSKENVRGTQLPKTKIPPTNPSDIIDESLLRKKSARLPEITEPEIIRHFINLSVKNHHVDKGIYPLGSCTMKLNAQG